MGDRYLVEGLLARGGMADVYRARDRILGRAVAVKVLRQGAADPRRFESETRLLERLDHPNLVPLLDAGERDGIPYLVFEFVDGPTLETRLRRGPLRADEALGVGRDMAQALAYVHGRGIVHRDVKPSNILLASDGRALLADFGIARLLADGARLTGTGLTVGTAAYLAPEQLADDEVTGAADVYALGLVLIEALTGRQAFTGTPQEVLAARAAAPPVVPDHLDLPWPRLLRAMTDPDLARRPAAAAVAATLQVPDAAELTASMAALTADTAELDTSDRTLVQGTRRFAQPAPAEDVNPRELRRMLGILAAVIVLALLAMAAIAGEDPGDRFEDRVADAPTSIPTTTSTSTTTTTTIPPSSVPPDAAELASTCAGLEARKAAIETEKQQLEETYRDDKDTRELLKGQLEAEKKGIDSQKQSLGC